MAATEEVEATNPMDVKTSLAWERAKWRREVRLALYSEYHAKGIMELSDNHVYELIFKLKRVGPPPLKDAGRSGEARSAVFTELEDEHDRCYYKRTDNTTLSDDPSAKRRRIRVFEYLPGNDERIADASEEGHSFLDESSDHFSL